jgi:hypothetical protein
MRDARPQPPRSVLRTLRAVLGPALLIAAPDGCRAAQSPPPTAPIAVPQPAPAPQPAPDAESQPVRPPGIYLGPAPLPGAVPARTRPEGAARPPRRRARA